MPLKTEAFVCKEKGSKLVLQEIELPELGDDDLILEVKHCGICYSDIGLLDNEFGFSNYPLVCGHEAIGRVVSVGRHVKDRHVGQWVGVGAQSGFCLNCKCCRTGSHNYCSENRSTLGGMIGGFTHKMHSQACAAVPIPEGMDPKMAGPLMCAGATIWTPISDFVKPTHRVGVVGIGGLGHIALQFLRAWGCHVTAMTRSASKEAEAKKHGAHDLLVTTDKKAMASAALSYDMIIVTASGDDLPTADLINALRPRGRLHFLGIFPQVTLDLLPLLFKGRQVSGSLVASPTDIEEMLQFAKLHNITPQCEHFPFEQINEAIAKLKKGEMRYRAVLSW